jgi:proteic killer suppression protein
MALTVKYATGKLEKRCTQAKEMAKAFDKVIAKSLTKRMVELQSADAVGDVLAGTGNWHRLTGNLSGLLSARLSGNWRILVRPADDSDDCTTVTIEDVRDYH